MLEKYTFYMHKEGWIGDNKCHQPCRFDSNCKHHQPQQPAHKAMTDQKRGVVNFVYLLQKGIEYFVDI